MKKQHALTISQLNLTLSKEAQIPVVSLQRFRELHKEQGTKFEKLVANITYVKRITDGYEFGIRDYKGGQKIVQILYDGSVSINRSHFTKLYDYKSGHLRINHNNNSVVIEKMILTCEAILADELPESFKGICVNCMQGDGNVFTADELGIVSDYSLDNLEWTVTWRNTIHGKYIKRVYNLVEGPCKYSANDYELYELLAIKDDEKIKEYLEKNYLED